MKESTRLLYKCILGRYVKVVWTHKINETQSDLYTKKDNCVNNWKCFLSVATTSGLVSVVCGGLGSIIPFFTTEVISVITAIFSAGLSYLTIRYKDGVLAGKAKENKAIALKLHDLRNRYESLMTDIMAGLLDDNVIVERRNMLREEECRLYADAPYASAEAVKLADKTLKIKKDSTTEEDEIDAIVPKDLIVH